MKAKDLIKKPFTLESIYKQIEEANNFNEKEIFIPRVKYVENNTIIQLMEDGFKLEYTREFREGTIISW